MKNETSEIICLAGGCFWGMEALLRNIPGVLSTEVAYTGGDVSNVNYQQICTGNTNHAEVVKISYNPEQLSLRQLLFEFFRCHNPTMLNQQGNDRGTQYRSAIFYTSDTQKIIAQQVIETVNQSKQWQAPIVTQLSPLTDYWRAEDYHQNYLQKNPNGYNCHYRRNRDLGEKNE